MRTTTGDVNKDWAHTDKDQAFDDKDLTYTTKKDLSTFKYR